MTMKILSIKTTDQASLIEAICQVLADGGLVVYPTETLYGIGADATNQAAVDKLLRFKQRREGKPLSIAVSDRKMAEQYVELNEQARQFYANFLPGPMTVVSVSKGKVATGVASERNTLGIRIPNYPLIRQIVNRFGRPITASSANPSYKKRPYSVEDVLNNLSQQQKELVDLIVDAGQLPPNEPSTVVDTTLEQPTVLRQGTIQLTEAETIVTTSAEATQELGQKLTNRYRHYLNERSLIFGLIGELGAGKTQFAKGVAKALGVDQLITSPTYTIAQEYSFVVPEQPRHQLVHIDTWRLFSDQEFLDLGFKTMVDNNAVMVIEWADKVKTILDEVSSEAKVIWLKLEYGDKENKRTITFSDKNPTSK